MQETEGGSDCIAVDQAMPCHHASSTLYVNNNRLVGVGFDEWWRGALLQKPQAACL